MKNNLLNVLSFHQDTLSNQGANPDTGSIAGGSNMFGILSVDSAG